MALTIEEMYQQIAGRSADPGGVSYWTNLFGTSVDPSEAAKFQNAIAEARAQGTEAAPVSQPTPVVSQQQQQPAARSSVSVDELYQAIANRAPDPGGAAYWTNLFGNSVEFDEAVKFSKAIAEARAQGTEPAPVSKAAPVTVQQPRQQQVTPTTMVAQPAQQKPMLSSSGNVLGSVTSSTNAATNAPAQAYTPDYFGNIQNYYSGYFPGQQLNTSMLQDWYGGGGNLNYGGNTYAQPAQLNPANQPAPSVDSSGGDYGQSFSNAPANTDLVNQLQNLNNPITKGLLTTLPLGIGGALSGYEGANLSNQLNDIVNLYGGTLGDKVNPYGSALMGLFGMTPDTYGAAGILSNQFDNTGQLAGYMQASTDPILGSIVNSLAERAGPGSLTAKDYGTIAQSIGQQINDVLAANPQLSYADAAAVTSFGLGLNTGPVTAAQDQALSDAFADSLGGYSYSDNSQSYSGGDSTSSSSADSTASDNSGVGGY